MSAQIAQGCRAWLPGLLFLTSVSFPITVLQAADTSSLATTPAEYIEVPEERVLDASIEAVNETTVSAQINGRVNQIFYDVDDYVEKGAVLLTFRDKEMLARFQGAQAAFEEAQTEYARMKKLIDQKLVSKSEMDKATARLKSARAKLDEARENLENTKVRAPYSGIVVKRHVELGELARVGQPLFTGVSLEDLRATANVPEDIINTVRSNKKARVIVNRDGEQGVEAASLTITPYADPATHTFNVRVNLPRGEYGVYPGMFVKVAFEIGSQRQLVVPVSAIARRSEVSAVYVVDKHMHVHFRQVRVGRRIGEKQVSILAGLSEGEQVALDPVKAAIYLKEHARVNVAPETRQ